MTDSFPSHAVVLAGGFGKRLAPYTTVFPKPLMPIQGRPVLELVLRRLRLLGIRDITLAVSYLEELIRAFFGDGSRFGLSIRYFRETTMLGTVGVLAELDDLPDPCLVVNGDVLSTLDLRAMSTLHAERGAAMTVGTHRRTVDIDYGVLRMDDAGRIVAYDEKPSLAYEVSVGVNLVGAAGRRQLERGQRCDVPTLVKRLIESGETVLGFDSGAYWRDIGRPDDYEVADGEFDGIRAEFGL